VDTLDSLLVQTRLELAEEFAIDVGSVDGGAGPEPTNEPHGVVAEAGPDVGHALPRGHAEPIHHALRFAMGVPRLLVGVGR